ncbi:MAG: hypothetical protein M3P08_18855 [Thermoproteota archaeon]|nr:hypothetical protein [Thermoproteota archaeon]
MLGVIVSIAVLSILNTLGILNLLYSENVDYFVDLILSVVLIIVVVPLVFLILKSRKVLDNWNDMFERTTISISINITIGNRAKEGAVKALAYLIGEISEPLQAYIESKKSDLSEFLNVNVNANLKFDVLLDVNHLLDDGSAISINLRRILGEYGSVVIKITDDVIDNNSVESFVDSLMKYTSLTKNEIGLGLIIGEAVTKNAQEFANKTPFLKRRRINNLLLLAKPSIPNIQE